MRRQRLPGPISSTPRALTLIIAIGAVILVLVAGSAFGIGWFYERSALSRERTVTGAAVQALAQQRLTRADLELNGSPVEPKRFEVFREIPGIFRVKVFDQSGRVVWSDEARLIGQRFPPGPNLKKALKGEMAMVIEAPTRDEHLYEFTRGYVAETYVPIMFGASSAVGGVIETYRDITDSIRDLRRTQRVIWWVAGGAGLLCYLALSLIVRGGGVKRVA